MLNEKNKTIAIITIILLVVFISANYLYIRYDGGDNIQDIKYAGDMEDAKSIGTMVDLGAVENLDSYVDYNLLKNRGKNNLEPQASYLYTKDEEYVYYRKELVPGADPKTFRAVISGDFYYEYGKDKNSVYWQTKKIEGADPNTFVTIGQQQSYEGCIAGRYSKDSKAVYYEDKIIKDADLSSFTAKIGASAFAQDSKHFYKKNLIVDLKEFIPCDYTG